MPLRLAEECELREVILTRPCKIQAPDGDISPLILSIMKPRPASDDGIEAMLRFEGKYFDIVEARQPK